MVKAARFFKMPPIIHHLMLSSAFTLRRLGNWVGGWVVVASTSGWMLGSASAAAVAPFGIHVIDEATGRGVPMVTLETNNRITLMTDSAGWVAFDEPGMIGRRVFFAVRSPGYAFADNSAGVAGVALDTKAGGQAEIKLMRLDIAERVYQVTGQGIYREATRLGIEVPLPRPNMNGKFITHGAVSAAVFRNRIFWIWNEAQGMQEPRVIEGVGAATSELPGKGGLDPSLGVHFDYLASDRVFVSDQPGRVQLEGVAAVNDAAGHARLVVHYSRFAADGARLEHGIAEFNEASNSFEPVTLLGEEFSWQCPRGHSVAVKVDGKDYIGFADPFCTTRVPAAYEAMLDPSQYEALSFDTEAKALIWQKTHPPTSQPEEAKLAGEGAIEKSRERLQMTSASDGKAISLASGSISWNSHRKKWVLLASDAATGKSRSGRIWFAEADDAAGPWTATKCVVNQEPAGLSDPLHLEAFDQDNGRVIYFDATVSASAGGTSALPRFDRNRMMFRLDLDDARLSGRSR